MAVNANDLRRGQAINYNGDISVVLDVQHRTPGNLRAFVQATLRSIRTGKSSDVRFSSTEKIEVIPMTTRKMDFSYKRMRCVFSSTFCRRMKRFPGGSDRELRAWRTSQSTRHMRGNLGQVG